MNRLLSALLLSDPDTLLLGQDTGVVWLSTKAGIPIALVAGPEQIPAVMARHRRGLMHVVFVGSAPTGVKWPRWGLRQFATHHVDESFAYHHVSGQRLALIETAAKSAATIEPFSVEELNQRFEATRGLVEAERAFTESGGTPFVTIGIAAVCVITFALQELWGGSQNIAGLVRMGANPGHAALQSPWTLLSSAFLHIGIGHLLLNMMALISFGPLLEKALGAPRYVALYFGSALGGSLLSAIGHTALVSAGASGALWGLMVGGAVLIWKPEGIFPPLMAARAKKQVWQPVIFNGIYSLTPGIDWLCHAGGGVAGGLLALLLAMGLRRGRAPVSAAQLRLAVAGAALLCAAALGTAWSKGRPWELSAPPPMERQFAGFGGLSLEVPKGLTEHREEGSLIYGRLDRDNLAVELRMGGFGQAMTDEQMEAERLNLRKLLHDQPPPESKLVGDVRDVEIAGAKGFLAESKYPNGVTTRTWGWLVPEGVLVVRLYTHPNQPSSWKSVGDAIVSSVRVGRESGKPD